MSWPRVLIADDELLLNVGLARVLTDAGLDVVGSVTSAERVVPAVLELRPDVLIVDVQMSSQGMEDGLGAARAVRRLEVGAAVLMLSNLVEERYPFDLIGDDPSGVGYLIKPRVGVDSLLEAVRRVADGGSALDPQLVRRMLARRRGGLLDRLGDDEREILALMAEGRSNTGIAAYLDRPSAKVEEQVAGVFEKLGLRAEPAVHRRVTAVLTLLRDPSP